MIELFGGPMDGLKFQPTANLPPGFWIDSTEGEPDRPVILEKSFVPRPFYVVDGRNGRYVFRGWRCL